MNYGYDAYKRKTIVELAAEAGLTDTATSNLDETQGTQWQSELVRFGEANRVFEQALQSRRDLVGSGDATLVIPKTTSHLDVTTTVAAEGDLRTNTEITNIDTVSVTFGASDFQMGMISITKPIFETSRVDLVGAARFAISQEIVDKPDNDIATELQDATLITQVVYGGSATAVDEVGAGDILTPDLVADAAAEIETSDFVADMLFIGVPQRKAFRKDDQFINAAAFGSDRVIRTGEVGDYLDIGILVTTNTPAFAASATDVNESPTTWTVAGHACPMVGVDKFRNKVAGVMAWKELPQIRSEFELKRNLHRIYLDQSYKPKLVQQNAVALIKVADV